MTFAPDWAQSARSKTRAPEITSLDPGQLQKLLVQLQQHLPTALYESVAALQVLRCGLCGKTFTAPPPPEAGITKYDPNVGLMIGILRFGGGMPHYRLEKLQKDLGIPLPAATQWELMEQSARDLRPAHRNSSGWPPRRSSSTINDTKMRIQSLKQVRAQAGCERTGIFTTSILCQVEDRSIALYFYFTGGNHAGENLTDLLQHRAAGLDNPFAYFRALHDHAKAVLKNPAAWLP